MTADLANLTPENIRMITQIARIGIDLNLDQSIINAATNIASAESSLTYNADNPTSSAWGPFQYLDDGTPDTRDSWQVSYERLVRDIGLGRIDISNSEIDFSLSYTENRYSHEAQIYVALNDMRNWYDGYPDIIANAWQDEVNNLVQAGYDPDTSFLQYAYLRHNTEVIVVRNDEKISISGQVVTVYNRDFTDINVSNANILSEAAFFLEKGLQRDNNVDITSMNIYQNANGDPFVRIEYSGDSNVLQSEGIDTEYVDFYGSKNPIIDITYGDGTSARFIYDENQNSIISMDHCFLAGTCISMWPVGSLIMPDANGYYDEDIVRARSWHKPIDEINTDDVVISYNKQGKLTPGRVNQIFMNQATCILDFWGTRVTPGHAYYCAGGKFEGEYVPLIDILRSDGVVQRQDGTLIRAATNCEVDSEDDRFVPVAWYRDRAAFYADFCEDVKIRLGTKILKKDGATTSFREVIEGAGLVILDSGLVRLTDGTEHRARWFGVLPTPEQYILARSGYTLADIYSVPWEGQHPPRLPAPRRRRHLRGEGIH